MAFQPPHLLSSNLGYCTEPPLAALLQQESSARHFRCTAPRTFIQGIPIRTSDAPARSVLRESTPMKGLLASQRRNKPLYSATQTNLSQMRALNKHADQFVEKFQCEFAGSSKTKRAQIFDLLQRLIGKYEGPLKGAGHSDDIVPMFVFPFLCLFSVGYMDYYN